MQSEARVCDWFPSLAHWQELHLDLKPAQVSYWIPQDSWQSFLKDSSESFINISSQKSSRKREGSSFFLALSIEFAGEIHYHLFHALFLNCLRALHVRRSKAFLDNFNSPAPILKTYSCSRLGGQLSSPGSSGALLSQRKKSKLAVTAMPFPRSSTELLSQALNDSSVMISSSYKLSKYDLMKPGSKIVKVRCSLRETKQSISRKVITNYYIS